MPIRLACSKCKTVLTVNDDWRGKRVRCPKCAEILPVPSGTAVREGAPRQATPDRPKEAVKNARTPVPQPQARRRSEERDERSARRQNDDRIVRDQKKPRSMMPWILGGAGGVAVAIVAAVIVLAIGSNPPQDVAKIPPPAPAEHRAETVVQPVPEKKVAPVAEPVPEKKAAPVTEPVVAVVGKQVEVPAGPVPKEIEPATTRKVKKATAYLRVKTKDGRVQQGSGFFALDRGLVFTNAHVLGMLEKSATVPVSVDVVVNSGEKDEFTRQAKVLGADRTVDLAVLQIQGDVTGLPDPLPVDSSDGLIELQKVYIFGFPFGRDLGKNITVSESSVSSLRKDDNGSVYQVQVNGGMHPGNSGGPVVDARGVVIGVSVAIISGTQINFAVPGEKVLGIANGGIQETRLGYAYGESGQVKLPVTVSCLDPMKRIRTVEVEVWTGRAGKVRPSAAKAPVAVPGDGERKRVALTYQDGKATLDVDLPALPLPAGQVVWVQPVCVNQANVKQWGAALAYERSDSAPLEHVPAEIVAKLSPGERTLKLHTKAVFELAKGREKITEADDMNLDVLESLKTTPKGAAISLRWGKGAFYEILGRKRALRNPAAYAAVKDHVHGFECAANGALSSFGFAKFNLKNQRTTEDANDMVHLFLTSYQLSSLALPNKTLQPGESWDANIRLLLGRQKKKDVMDVLLKCTYEGSRKADGKQQALASLLGEIKILKTDAPLFRKPTDRATGYAIIDVETGQVAKLEISVNDEREIGGILMTHIFAVALTRTSGNTLNIAMTAPDPAKSDPAKVNPKGGSPKVDPAKGAGTRVLGGGFGRDSYRDVAPEGGVLVGLEVGVGKFANLDVVHSLRAVFRKGNGETLGVQHGTDLSRVVRLVAKPGYAVGALTVKAGANVDGLSITFMRLKDGRLDVKDSYESEWAGDKRPGGRTILTGNGRLIVGIAGLQSNKDNTGLGLIFGNDAGKAKGADVFLLPDREERLAVADRPK